MTPMGWLIMLLVASVVIITSSVVGGVMGANKLRKGHKNRKAQKQLDNVMTQSNSETLEILEDRRKAIIEDATLDAEAEEQEKNEDNDLLDLVNEVKKSKQEKNFVVKEKVEESATEELNA